MYVHVYHSGPLPVFKSVEKHQTIDLKRRLRSLESRPNRYKISNNKMRSQTIVTDDFESSFIRVPFSYILEGIMFYECE